MRLALENYQQNTIRQPDMKLFYFSFYNIRNPLTYTLCLNFRVPLRVCCSDIASCLCGHMLHQYMQQAKRSRR